MTILVSMPYYRCPDEVRRAVRSVLDQTHRDLALVVIADGDDPPLDGIRDDRLVVYRLRSNHGAYFAASVALAANPFDWFAPHAADDWSDPDHLERLYAVPAPVRVTGVYWRHDGGRVRQVAKNLETGLYATAALRSIGGYNAAERIGQDSMTMQVLRAAGYNLNPTTHPTYHYVKRAGSLTRSVDTGRGSPARLALIRRNRELVATLQHVSSIDAIRQIREARVPVAIREMVEHYATDLRGHLS